MPDPFITVQELSDMLGRDVTADNGAALAIDAACEVCRTLTGQTFNAGTATISLDGQGTDALALPQQPVNTVGTVTVNGGTITDFTVTSHGLLLRGTAGPTWPLGVRPVWPKGRQNVGVTYEYGYAEVPTDVQMVARSLASRLIVQGVATREVVGDVQIQYAAGPSDVTPSERLILSRYWRPQSF